MKVLYLAPHLSTGGMPQFLLKRIQALKKYTNFIIYVVEYQCYSLDFVVQRNAIIDLVGSNFTTLHEDKMELFKVIDEFKPDIVHIDEMSERLDRAMIKRLYSQERSYRIAETCHDTGFNPSSDKIFNPDLYIFCSPYHEKTFSSMESMSVTIEYPIDKKQQKERGAIRNVLNVGLWTPGKNQAEGIEIARKYPDITFNFVGNQADNFKRYWEPLMKDLPDNVVVHGEKGNIDEFMSNADAFMFNSTLECNPLVLREAISHGLPIIARNLPQYGDMFTKYVQPIDTDLRSIKPNYDVPSDNATPIFAFKQEAAYNKVLSYPIKKQTARIVSHFVDNPFLEVKCGSDESFKVSFYDDNGLCHYENDISSNSWVKLNRRYFTNWTSKVVNNGEVIYSNTLDLRNKRVFVSIESSSLGDTLAWAPYALEFQNKHKCKVIMSTFWNKILYYPELELVEPGVTVNNIYALYRIGWFYDKDREPELPNTIPLQKTATNILGLEYREIKPSLIVPSIEGDSKHKRVAIATNSTAGCKFWTKEGWQEVIDYLNGIGYEVINVAIEKNEFKNATQIEDNDIEKTMKAILDSEFFIGLGSGASWLAWALGKKVVMIANFSEEWHEFECIRPVNKSVCNGCWNNPNFKFDKGDWDWCPIWKGTDRKFECQKSITAKMVIDCMNDNLGLI
jgi:autotransporter strand-loop-strand O-heptosyltransferase